MKHLTQYSKDSKPEECFYLKLSNVDVITCDKDLNILFQFASGNKFIMKNSKEEYVLNFFREIYENCHHKNKEE